MGATDLDDVGPGLRLFVEGIAQRYDRIAGLIGVFDRLFFLPPRICADAPPLGWT